MYAKVEKSRYQQVTGNARAAILGGRFIASVIAQVLVTFNWMDLRELNFLTLGGNINAFQCNLLIFVSIYSSSNIASHWSYVTVSWCQFVFLLSA